MPPQPTTDPWIAFRRHRPRARVRLFCFPYAGGSALAYREWTTEMPEEIDVLPVQLPGRERRLRERPFTRMDSLVDALAGALGPYLDQPFAIFGHSLGAAIGYELAQRLRQERGLTPVHMSVSARQAPHLPPDDELLYKLSDPELCERLREMNGTPTEVLANPELMQLMLPLLRSDFELNETYSPPAHPALDCPVTAFGGLTDGEVSKEELAAWKETTTGLFRLRMFAGDHFYLHDGRHALIGAVAEELLRRIL